MKTHPGTATNAALKVQASDNDNVDECSSKSPIKNPGQLDEKQGLAISPEKGNKPEPLPIGGEASVDGEKPMDTTVYK